MSDRHDDDPGALTIDIGDDALSVVMNGGGRWTMPIGPVTLLTDMLDANDPPRPADLTNALGLVHDHLDDLIVESPMLLSVPSIAFTGRHAHVLARVETGTDDPPSDVHLTRADADELFRTLVAEPRDERRHNPGLPLDDVDLVVATCCVVLGIVRRLDHHGARIRSGG